MKPPVRIAVADYGYPSCIYQSSSPSRSCLTRLFDVNVLTTLELVRLLVGEARDVRMVKTDPAGAVNASDTELGMLLTGLADATLDWYMLQRNLEDHPALESYRSGLMTRSHSAIYFNRRDFHAHFAVDFGAMFPPPVLCLASMAFLCHFAASMEHRSALVSSLSLVILLGIAESFITLLFTRASELHPLQSRRDLLRHLQSGRAQMVLEPGEAKSIGFSLLGSGLRHPSDINIAFRKALEARPPIYASEEELYETLATAGHGYVTVTSDMYELSYLSASCLHDVAVLGGGPLEMPYTMFSSAPEIRIGAAEQTLHRRMAERHSRRVKASIGIHCRDAHREVKDSGLGLRNVSGLLLCVAAALSASVLCLCFERAAFFFSFRNLCCTSPFYSLLGVFSAECL